MLVITLVGASPLMTNLLVVSSIGAFVGGQNVIGATAGMSEETEVEIVHYAWLAVLACAVASVWRLVSRFKLFDGYAGRLGTTTFLGMNLSMIMFVPADVVSWKLYVWGFIGIIHVGEEDSSTSPKSPYSWAQEAESAIVYVLGVMWLGLLSGGTRLFNKRRIEGISQPPLNNILTPVVYALSSMLVVNATQYGHAPAIYNGFAVGSYVGMVSLNKITNLQRFALVSAFASVWGLTLTPFFVGFAGKNVLALLLLLFYRQYILQQSHTQTNFVNSFCELILCRQIGFYSLPWTHHL